ncbi:conserved hypothetical protein [Talaromyces stipitatus ATCC 10500]|uniref:Tat pathway signal sequence n=1 Tax=Talaromyces stipitatus (strain ATCC 10500 / CBS 375.48 / QM 6759 / NRRL 1006) TaxID=441959 RepID=B8MGU8_TALSN|nr:uncharacterized protein TSTA_014240 [Talaromyces stipitatus ATCC 10500]EED16330.1 conserved hypothetical protein [Talaromyces stipitatus ATCC 10500]
MHVQMRPHSAAEEGTWAIHSPMRNARYIHSNNRECTPACAVKMLNGDEDDTATAPLYTACDEEHDSAPEKEVQYYDRRRFRSIHVFTAICYLILMGMHVKLWIHSKKLESDLRTMKPDLFPSLAHSSAFRKDNRVFSLTVADTPFAGDPSLELDQAWHNLLEDSTIRVSKEDLDYYNITSLPLADGSGFASELFVTHELHCLKKIRQYIYKETYFEHVQGFARNELKRHVDHCIETLRQGIMCRGDVSLATYTYLQGSNDVTARSWGSHQCIDFESLTAWTRERAVDIFRPGVLPNPESLGPEHITAKKEPH